MTTLIDLKVWGGGYLILPCSFASRTTWMLAIVYAYSYMLWCTYNCICPFSKRRKVCATDRAQTEVERTCSMKGDMVLAQSSADNSWNRAMVCDPITLLILIYFIYLVPYAFKQLTIWLGLLCTLTLCYSIIWM